MEAEEYRLDRHATALKRAGDLDGAIAALRQRKALMGVQYTDDKLAKYLQAAGRFDEAMTEIQWLLDQIQAWSEVMFGHQPLSVRQTQRTSWRGRVHGHAALICKREGRGDLQAEHERLQAACARLGAKLKPAADADRAARLRR